MNERIRSLRENKKMSRAAFGEILGVSGDVINNLERGRVEAKEPMIKLICREFQVNEQWLRTGEGEMFDEDADGLEAFLDTANASDMERRAVRAFFSIPADIREPALKYFLENLAGGKIREKGRSEQKAWPEEGQPPLPPGWTDEQIEMWMAGYEYAQKKNKAKKEAEDEDPGERSYPSLNAS